MINWVNWIHFLFSVIYLNIVCFAAADINLWCPPPPRIHSITVILQITFDHINMYWLHIFYITKLMQTMCLLKWSPWRCCYHGEGEGGETTIYYFIYINYVSVKPLIKASIDRFKVYKKSIIGYKRCVFLCMFMLRIFPVFSWLN